MEEIIEQPNLETENESANQDGSIYGKFKSAKNLLEAYNNLEAEFTKKCQKLAEIENKQAKFAENCETSLDEVCSATDNKDKYKKEITEIINNNNLENLPNKYQVAYNLVKNFEDKSADNLNNPQYLEENIFNNPSIRDKIISDYIQGLNNIPSSPTLMTGNPSNILITQTSQPKTLSEAGKIFEKMLK